MLVVVPTSVRLYWYVGAHEVPFRSLFISTSRLVGFGLRQFQ